MATVNTAQPGGFASNPNPVFPGATPATPAAPASPAMPAMPAMPQTPAGQMFNPAPTAPMPTPTPQVPPQIQPATRFTASSSLMS